MQKNLKKRFTQIYEENSWADDESVSGGGSRMDRTVEIRDLLPRLLSDLQIHSMLDAGCGDWNWMSRLDLGKIDVRACDIVPEMIAENAQKYSGKGKFFVADITSSPLPKVDLIICRTVLFHLSFANVKKALHNFENSESAYLLATTHPHQEVNEDIEDGNWRRLNLLADPFNLPDPLFFYQDGPGNDGYLALWNLL
jgi:SAM-dependent methyltransferase